MLQLPVELRRDCFNRLKDDVETLKAIRLTNKDLGTLATETLFRIATLNNTEESAEKFTTLVHSPLNSLVRHIVINTSDDPENENDEQEEAIILDSFGKAIAILCDFSNLEEVEVRFARECAVEDEPGNIWHEEVAETISVRNEVLEYIFSAVRRAKKVRNLAIKNLQDHMDKTIFESEDFQTVRDRLTKLHLQIATEADEASPENSIDMPACHQGFGRDLPNIWLKPLTDQLTHLTLYGAECLWGIWPFVDLRNVPPFPKLRSLSLGNFTIAHDWQIDWILSHAPTLEELRFDDCPIITTLRMLQDQANTNFPDLPHIENSVRTRIGNGRRYFKTIDLRWHHVFNRFRTGLPYLQHFATGSGKWNDGSAFEERYELMSNLLLNRYHMFDCGIGPTQWISMDRMMYRKTGYTFRLGGMEDKFVAFPQCDKVDMVALVALLEVVQERANAKV